VGNRFEHSSRIVSMDAFWANRPRIKDDCDSVLALGVFAFAVTGVFFGGCAFDCDFCFFFVTVNCLLCVQ